MKYIKSLKVFALSFGLIGSCFAIDAASQIAVDPTLVFFTSLGTCIPGDYTEQNDLTDQVGQAYLKQQIVSLENGICNVKLTTPDNRSMTCAFPMQKMTNFNDQHFLQGMIQRINNMDQNGVNAEELWSNMKATYCNFDAAPQ